MIHIGADYVLFARHDKPLDGPVSVILRAHAKLVCKVHRSRGVSRPLGSLKFTKANRANERSAEVLVVPAAGVRDYEKPINTNVTSTAAS